MLLMLLLEHLGLYCWIPQRLLLLPADVVLCHCLATGYHYWAL